VPGAATRRHPERVRRQPLRQTGIFQPPLDQIADLFRRQGIAGGPAPISTGCAKRARPGSVRCPPPPLRAGSVAATSRPRSGVSQRTSRRCRTGQHRRPVRPRGQIPMRIRRVHGADVLGPDGSSLTRATHHPPPATRHPCGRPAPIGHHRPTVCVGMSLPENSQP